MIPAVHVSTQIRVQDAVPVWNYVCALLLSPTEVSGVISVIEEQEWLKYLPECDT